MQMLCKSLKPLDVSLAIGGPSIPGYQSPGNLTGRKREWSSLRGTGGRAAQLPTDLLIPCCFLKSGWGLTRTSEWLRELLPHTQATMYSSCLLEKEAGMYLGTLRSPAGGGTAGTGGPGSGGSPLPASNFTAAPAYAHYMGYPHVPSMEPHGPSLGVWGSPYSPPREDWNIYPGPSSTMSTVSMNDMTSSPSAFGCQEYSNLGPAGGGSSSGSLPAPASGSLFPIDADAVDASSPNRSSHSPYAWMRKTVQVTGE